jgi:predicted transcriptional regulator
LPVVEADGTLIGIITESDLLRRPETGTADKHRRWYDAFFGPDKSANEYVHSHGSKVHEVMSREAITVDENTDLDHAVDLMEKHRVKRLPVLRSDKLVGIVSRANLVRALVGLHRSTPEASRSDLAIREQILDDIDKESWTAGASVDVVVRKGVVDLWGEVADPPQKEAIRVLVEAVPGVSEVFDHLSLSEQVTVT